MRRSIRWTIALVLLAAPVHAGVITVDDSGGADFFDLPPAVAAAQDGDLILVHPGLYSAFAVQAKSLTILGLASGQVRVDGSTTVSLVSSGTDVTLVDLDLQFLHLSDSPGTIVLDGLRVWGPSLGRLSVDGCADVRAIGLHLDAVAIYGSNECCGDGGLDVRGASRCEVVESLLLGRPGKPIWYGEDAAAATGGSFLHLAGSTSLGGKGGNDSFCGFYCVCPGLPGGLGVLVSDSGTRTRIAGTPADLIDGGATGSPPCIDDVPGLAVFSSAKAWYSGATVVDGVYSELGTTVTSPQPPDPWLGRAAPVAVGGVLVLEVHGRPDDVVTLYLGRSAVVQAIPGVDIEQLTSQERAFPLGPVGPSQVKVFSMPLAPNFVQGFGFYAQAKVDRGGVELRTNSVPIVVR